MAKKFRCPRPINRLVMHRTRGLSGVMGQNVGGACVMAPGQFWGPSGAGGGGGGTVLAFSAAVADATTGEMLLQDKGTGTPTSTHTATIYAPDYQGVYQAFAANEPVWRGARISGGKAYGTDALGDPLPQGPVLWHQPAATNILPYSDCSLADYTAGWTNHSGIATLTEDLTDIFGVPNSACTLGDASAAYAYIYRNISVTAASWGVIRAYVKKASAPVTSFPGFQFQGTGATVSIGFDPYNGIASALDIDSSSPEFDVIDEGSHWVWLSRVNTGNSSVNTINIFPAICDSSFNASAAATGTFELLKLDIFDNTTIPAVRGIGPIKTDAAAASTDSVEPGYSGSNISDIRGALYFEWRPTIANTEATGDIEILSTTTGASLLYYDATNSQFKSTDGTNTISAGGAIVADTVYKIGLVYGDDKMRLSVDGTWGAEGTYDGAYEGASLYVGRNAPHASGIRNLNSYNIADYDAGKTLIEDLMGVA